MQRFPLFCAALFLAGSSFTAELSVPEQVDFRPGIEFANPDNQHLKLDLAMPKNASQPLPAVVCIHGGGFRAGTREGYDPLCLSLAQHGYVALTVTYRLSPAYRFPAAVQDCKAAVRWLRAHAAEYGVDPLRIGVLGGSAGGHLAQMLGYTGGVKALEGEENLDQFSNVSCVVDYFGPTDFTKSYGKSVDAAEVLPLFLGGDLQTKLREHVVASPLNWVTPAAAPTLILHGTEDKYVAYEQSTWLVERLQACQVEVQLITFEGAGHGFKGADAEKADAAALAFLDQHLKSKP